VLPSPSQYGASMSGIPPAPDSGDKDLGLDLDLDLGGPSTAPGGLDSTQTLAPSVKLPDNDMTELDFSPSRTPARPQPQPEAHSFDLSDISLDLDLPTEAPLAKPAASAPAPLGRESGLGAIDLPPLDNEHDDPLSRKLELAEEFRQIGDTDGARDLLQEVVAKASGTVKTRAQSMLADLG